MHCNDRCVIHLLWLRVYDQDAGTGGGWCTQKAESSADGLLVAWLLWPSGPLSSDCHSWGLRDRFLWRSHSSKLTPPTVCPDQPLTMPFGLTDGKTEVWNQPISSSNDLSFLLSPLAHPSIIFTFTYFTLRLHFCLCLALRSFLSGVFPDVSISQFHIFPWFFKTPFPTLPPSALAFTFIYLVLFHLGGSNPLTGSFIRMTSSNPFVAVGWINPAHSLALTEFIMEAQI